MKIMNEKQKNIIEKKIKIENEKWIILLDTLGKKEFTQDEMAMNLFCINSNYEIIWRVCVPKYPNDPHKGGFTSFSIKNSAIFAKTFFGFEYKIDKNTGFATCVGWDK